MTQRRAIPFSPPAIQTSGAWRSVNGPARLARILKRWPSILPYTAVIRMKLAGCTDGTVPTFAQGSVSFAPDADFYIFGTSVGGWIEEGDVSPGLPSPNFVPPDDLFMLVDLFEESGGNRWSSVPVYLPHVFGDGQLPYIWPVPFIVKGGSNLTAKVTNRCTFSSGDAITLFLCFHGFRVYTTTPDLPIDVMMHPALLDTFREYRRQGRLGRAEPFAYGLNLGLGRNAVLYETEQVSATVSDADFVALDCNAFVWGQTGLDSNTETLSTTPMQDDFTVHEVQDRSTLRLSINSGQAKLDTRPVDLSTMTGTGRRPYHFAKPLIIPAGADVTAIVGDPGPIVESSEANEPRDKFITLIGARIFPDERR